MRVLCRDAVGAAAARTDANGFPASDPKDYNTHGRGFAPKRV